jgi:hypothetical protein
MAGTILPIGTLHPTDNLPRPQYINHCVFAAASSGHAFDTPSGANFVSFSADCNFVVRYGSTAAVYPSSDVIDGSGNELNATMRNIGSTLTTTGLSLIAPSSGIVTMSWFAR